MCGVGARAQTSLSFVAANMYCPVGQATHYKNDARHDGTCRTHCWHTGGPPRSADGASAAPAGRTPAAELLTAHAVRVVELRRLEEVVGVRTRTPVARTTLDSGRAAEAKPPCATPPACART